MCGAHKMVVNGMGKMIGGYPSDSEGQNLVVFGHFNPALYHILKHDSAFLAAGERSLTTRAALVKSSRLPARSDAAAAGEFTVIAVRTFAAPAFRAPPAFLLAAKQG